MNDFLKFADTLQVKGLSQSEKNSSIPASAAAALAAAAAAAAASDSPAASVAAAAAAANDKLSVTAKDSPKIPKNNNTLKNPPPTPANKTSPSSSSDQPIPLIKGPTPVVGNGTNNNDVPPSLSAPATPAPGLPQPPTSGPLSHPSVQELAKNYLATLGKFPGMFPAGINPEALANAGLQPPPGADLFSHLSSPNLYRALKRTYPETNPVLFKQNPLFKKVFGDNPDLYPRGVPMGDNDDSDGIAERSPPPPPPPGPTASAPGLPGLHGLPPTTMALAAGFSPASIPGLMRNFPLGPSIVSPAGTGVDSENGFPDRCLTSSPRDSDHSPYPPSSLSGANTPSGANHHGEGSPKSEDGSGPKTNPDGSPVKRIGGSVKSAAGRGSRLERMIAAEYKIISEYSEMKADPAALPVMTPELMKSRRTHSLQLAIAEIMHNRASVQSAATKYHIPRETLRRHYQRYLKTMGIEKPPPPPPQANNNGASPGGGGVPPTSGTPPANAAAAAVAAAAALGAAGRSNNNAKMLPGLQIPHPGTPGTPPLGLPKLPLPGDLGKDDPASNNGFSSLMELGQAFGIWGADVEGGNAGLAAHAAAARAHMEKIKAAAAAAAAAGADFSDRADKDKLVIDEDEDVDDVEVDDEEPLSPGGPEDEAKGSSADHQDSTVPEASSNGVTPSEPADEDEPMDQTPTPPPPPPATTSSAATPTPTAPMQMSA